MNEVTIVTAFFDIGREKFPGFERGTAHYLEYFRFWARIKNRVIVYTSSDYAEAILEARRNFGLADKTEVIVTDDLSTFDKETLEGIKKVMARPEYLAFRKYRKNPECNYPLYNYVTYLKPFFVMDAIKRGLAADTVAWLDFGFSHGGEYYTHSADFDYLWQFDCKDKMHLFAVRKLDNKPIQAIICDNKAYISGALIIGPIQRWQTLRDSFQEAMRRLIELNLTDDDQTLELMSYRSAPQHYALRKIHNFFQPLFLAGGSHLRYIKVERHIYRGCRDKLREARAGGQYATALKYCVLYMLYKITRKKEWV